ncbi:MAG TPA: glycosyltransferase family 4 protein [Actinomycetota bacterium]|nr:glycosyltransferase family 4 protein [Actinomycetota bacterium]
MRIAICHPQTPFSRGGGEFHTEGLARALRAAGHDVDILPIPFKWYPPEELVHQMALWRSLDLSEANGMPIDMVIALKFPAYLVRHPRKVVWLIHQHRAAYELWDHPVYGDLAMDTKGPAVRDLVWKGDRVALAEARRIFSNSANVRDRLRESLGMSAEVLYHRSPMSEVLLAAEPREYGDYLLYPSRLEPLKRQALVTESMRHVQSDVRLVLVGTGSDDDKIRRLVDQRGLGDRVVLEGRVSDDRLTELYRGALGVYYGPYDEDYGYVTLEAMAARRPVMTTTDSGGPLEFVRDGENGVVVRPRPKDIAAGLDRLAEDREAARAMGEAGHKLFSDTVPSWPEVVARILG